MYDTKMQERRSITVSFLHFLLINMLMNRMISMTFGFSKVQRSRTSDKPSR